MTRPGGPPFHPPGVQVRAGQRQTVAHAFCFPHIGDRRSHGARVRLFQQVDERLPPPRLKADVCIGKDDDVAGSLGRAPNPAPPPPPSRRSAASALRGRGRRKKSLEPSVEPSSTTITSARPGKVSSRFSNVSCNFFPSLRGIMTTDSRELTCRRGCRGWPNR